MTVEIAFLIGLALLIFLAVKLKISAFIALLVSALTIGLLSGLDGQSVITTITSGFGNMVTKIGIIIILGVILGKLLEDSRAAEKIAISALKLVGAKRSPIAMAFSGFLISIPVYSDVGYVILAPLAKIISKKSGVSFAIMAVALASGLLATHVFIPPTPGPIAVAGLLGIQISDMIIWGSFAAIFMTLAGWAYAQFLMPHIIETDIPEISEKGKSDETFNLPGLLVSLLPLVVPMFFIILSSFLPGESKDTFTNTLKFLGEPNIAMGCGIITGLILLGKKNGIKGFVNKIIDISIKDAGPIIFITAAGGSLGAILKVSGAGKAIADLVVSSHLPFILLPFFISGILKTVQGSGTVAVVTAAILCQPIASELSCNPIIIALAAGSGARLICHANDSFFWVFTKVNNYNTKESLKTLSLSNISMSLGGLFATWIVSLII